MQWGNNLWKPRLKYSLVFCSVFLWGGCGGGAPSATTKTPVPVTAPVPPSDPPPPVPPAPPPDPTPSPTPTISLVGPGSNPILDEKGELAYVRDGNAVANGQTYLGNLIFYDGHVLTTVVRQTDAAEQVYVDDNLVTQASITQVLALQGAELVEPANALEVTASAAHTAWVGAECHVWIDGVDVWISPTGACPEGLVIHGDYVGWVDGAGTWLWHTGQGLVMQTGSPLGGVVGMDFNVGDKIAVAWVQYAEGSDGSEVWVNNGTTSRVSQPVKPGFSGAGNPVYVGSNIAWLDDANGSEPGHFDVYLNGLDLTNSDDAIDQLVAGGGVLAWSDQASVWLYQ